MLAENGKRMCQLGSVHSARDVVPWAFSKDMDVCELHGTWDGAVPLGAELGEN